MKKNQQMWAIGIGVVIIGGYFYWKSTQPKEDKPLTGDVASTTTAAPTTTSTPAKFSGSQSVSPSDFN
jgi:hypothetical protein